MILQSIGDQRIVDCYYQLSQGTNGHSSGTCSQQVSEGQSGQTLQVMCFLGSWFFRSISNMCNDYFQ